MANRYYSEFAQRKVGKPRAAKPPGGPGVPSPSLPGEKTANWPSAGPEGPKPFNRTMKTPVVKTTARKQGLC